VGSCAHEWAGAGFFSSKNSLTYDGPSSFGAQEEKTFKNNLTLAQNKQLKILL
jgi:hypothetical protein